MENLAGATAPTVSEGIKKLVAEVDAKLATTGATELKAYQLINPTLPDILDLFTVVLQEKMAKELPSDILELSDLVAEFNGIKETLSKEKTGLAAIVSAHYTSINEQLAQKMLDEEMGTFKRSGLQFIFSNKFFASAEPEKKEDLLATLKERHPELVYETYNANTFRSFTRGEYEANGDELPEWMDSLVKVGHKPAVTIKKAK